VSEGCISKREESKSILERCLVPSERIRFWISLRKPEVGGEKSEMGCSRCDADTRKGAISKPSSVGI